MLLSLSLTPVHSFGNHFRSPEVRRSMKRNSVVAEAEDRAIDIAIPPSWPVAMAPHRDDEALKFIANTEPTQELAFVRRLRRLKLGFSRSGTPDSLP
jgi:hypothetical protein